MSKSQGTGIVLLVVPQHLGANNAVKPTAYGGGLPWLLDVNDHSSRLLPRTLLRR